MRLAAVDGGSDVYTAGLSTTRRTKRENEATHELLRENEEARLPQSSANEDDMILSFCQENSHLRTQQGPRYKFPLEKFNSGVAQWLMLPPWVPTPRWHRKDVGMTTMWVSGGEGQRGAEIEKCYEFIMNEHLLTESRYF